jgi:ribonuclease VapC
MSGIVVDTSAVVAIVLGEEDAERHAQALQHAAGARMSAVNVVEAAIVVEARQGPDAARDLALLLETTRVEIEPFAGEDVSSAVAAWRRFGKGRHPAGLNLGDCFAYALARASDEPLLFKGEDFRQTDIPAVPI